MKCPGCGDTKEKRINFILSDSPSKAYIQYTCLLCGAPFYVNCILDPNKWISPITPEMKKKIEQAAKNEVL